ncbi:FAD-dependent oxidoreductase [Candidatus Saccharibacteria bacterium QS_5_54_17]|nr:MAG: FAD-dependent oxidoreductase [Candidatus Saccharibacteria bacterium QS_5_54_17]
MLQLPDTEKPFWREAYPASVYPELTEDISVDVAVVGAGITGLTSAYLLKQAGYTVAVLEKDTVGAGTTGRTTGKVTSQHELNYYDLGNRLGQETARVYAAANNAAVEQVASIIEKEQIECDWQRDDNYIFTDDGKKVGTLTQEAKVAADLGLPATLESDSPLPFKTKVALRFANQGKFHAQKYLSGLAEAVNGDGSFVFENSKAAGFKDGVPARVKTEKASVAADHVIIASHIPTFPLLARGSYALLEYPTESFAIAGKIDSSLDGMYISPDKNHHSIQPIKVNGENMLLIVGAGGNIPGLGGSRKARFRELADYGEKWLGMTTITHCWSDMDYIAYDEVPLIGKLYPWSRRLYTATGFKKWGLSGGTAAAMILSDVISGKENPWASTFDSTRFRPITSIPRRVIRHIKNKFQ